MFNKLKQFKDLRDQAKTMQNALADESVTIEKKCIKIVINGNLEVQSIELPESATPKELEGNVKDAVNDGIKKTQRLMAQKMQEMGGLSGLGM